MSEERHQRLAEVFAEAAACADRAEAREVVARLCGEDASLRAEVESLLGFHEAGDELLDRTCPVGSGIQSLADALGAATQPTLAPGTRIGEYTIEGVRGSGGMGVVYMARQDRPARRVALKLMRPDLLSRQMLRRFEHECELLGRLRHPGIAQIYQAGTARVGDGPEQPYLAMEYVDGKTLLEFAAEHELDQRARSSLVARVARAVHHAHTRGVIHRDLKPSNILVDATAELGSEESTILGPTVAPGQPKILDFGVARAADREPGATLNTSVGQIVGTLAYMSPEQIAADPAEVDTRTNVYALGVVLYQLLSGKLPHDLATRPLAEAARIIRDEEPARLTSMDRHISPELSAIAGKAMEKDRARRYGSAADMADDLEHYLRGEPIAARGDSAAYVLRKRLARYKGAVAATLVIAAGATWFAVSATRQSARNALLAGDLAAQLRVSTIERARAMGLAGNRADAEDLLWEDFVREPEGRRARWALRELYARAPLLATSEGQHPSDSTRFFPDGTRLAIAGSPTFAAEVWDRSLGRRMLTVGDAGTASRLVSVDGTGRLIATVGADRAISIWNAADGALVRRIAGPDTDGTAIELSRDGTWVFLIGRDRTLRQWNVQDGSEVRVHRAAADLRVLALSPDGSRLAAGGMDKSIAVFDLRQSAESVPRMLVGPGGWIADMAFSPDGETLASISFDRTVRLWDLRTLTSELLADPIQNRANDLIGSIEFSRDGRTLYTGTSAIEEWDVVGRAWKGHVIAPQRYRASFGLSPDGTMFVTEATDGRVRVWEGQTGGWLREMGTLAGERSYVPAVAPDQTLAARISGMGVEVRAGLGTSARSFTITQGLGRASAVAVGGAPTRIAVGSGEGVVRMLDPGTGEAAWASEALGSHVASLAFGQTGRMVAAALTNGRVVLLSAEDGSVRAKYVAPRQGRVEMRFSEGDDLLMWCGSAGIMASRRNPLSDMARGGGGAAEITVASSELGTAASLGVFLRGSMRMSAGGSGGEILVLDISGERPMLMTTIDAHSGSVTSLCVNAERTLLASAGADGMVKVWAVNPSRDREPLTGTRECPDAGSCLATFDLGGLRADWVGFSSDSTRLRMLVDSGTVLELDLAYCDRHIAGNFAYQLSLRKDVPGPTRERLGQWAQGVREVVAKRDGTK